MHSSRMRTARSLPYGGVVSVTETPQTDRDPPQQTETPPTDRDPWTETETPLWTDRHL